MMRRAVPLSGFVAANFRVIFTARRGLGQRDMRGEGR